MNTPRRAFTLIETLVAIALFAALMAITAGFFFRFSTLSLYQTDVEQTAGSGTLALAALHAALLSAARVETTHAFRDGTYTSTTTSLVLALPAEDSSGALVTGETDYEAFYASSTALYREIDAAAGSARVSGTTLLSDTLSALLFSYNAADPSAASTVGVSVTTSTTTRSGVATGGGALTVRLRNF